VADAGGTSGLEEISEPPIESIVALTMDALTDEERTEELARMLGGARISTSARAHARQLIEEAASEPRPQRD